MASGLRICFPAPGLKEREGVREEGEGREEVLLDRQLASFSLNLGPTAAKLVVSLVTPGLLEREAEVRMKNMKEKKMKKKQVRMLVSLTVSGDWPGDPLMLRCTLFIFPRC